MRIRFSGFIGSTRLKLEREEEEDVFLTLTLIVLRDHNVSAKIASTVFLFFNTRTTDSEHEAISTKTSQIDRVFKKYAIIECLYIYWSIISLQKQFHVM